MEIVKVQWVKEFYHEAGIIVAVVHLFVKGDSLGGNDWRYV